VEEAEVDERLWIDTESRELFGGDPGHDGSGFGSAGAFGNSITISELVAPLPASAGGSRGPPPQVQLSLGGLQLGSGEPPAKRPKSQAAP
jgi:hypothetical protein